MALEPVGSSGGVADLNVDFYTATGDVEPANFNETGSGVIKKFVADTTDSDFDNFYLDVDGSRYMNKEDFSAFSRSFRGPVKYESSFEANCDIESGTFYIVFAPDRLN